MGGYGSGRTKRHHTTNECLAIDTMLLRKRGMLTPDKLETGDQVTFTSQAKTVKGKVTETHHDLYLLVKRYAADETGEFSRWGAIGHLTLIYGVRRKDAKQGKRHCVAIPLVVTHPHYGGVRYWLLAPCCGRRVRIVYLPTFGQLEQLLPHCRDCLDLHYASQLQSYTERHKTYERYLLANYGYAWTEVEYLSLRERYLQMTPEIEDLRQRSILDLRMRMVRCLMSFTRLMMRTHMRALSSLKSEEDQELYLDHITREHGEAYALDVVSLLRVSCRLERNARAASSEVFDEAYEHYTDALLQALRDDSETDDVLEMKAG
jgi:hypothetical protein